MNDVISNWLTGLPGIQGYENLIATSASITLILLIALLGYFITKRVLVRSIYKLIDKTKSNLDDVLVEHKVFNRIAYLVPAFLIYKLAPGALGEYPLLSDAVTTLTAIYLVIVTALLVDSVIDSLMDIYHSFPISRQIPIQNFGQVAKLLIYFVAMILIISLIVGESPLKLLAGLGAMTAVLMLIFKDPILGFVAGLQLSYNKMVRLGDWVEVPQHKADGDIMEIGLTTVKVRNFDNTITTVPTQSLISESFKNWRGMQESPGRRIKRAIYIDVNSIRFCDEEALQRYRSIDHIKEYIETKQHEIEIHNQQNVGNPESNVNRRRLTNIGTFRAYVLAYLKNHPAINQNLTLLVRQLSPTESGLPLEVYAFCAEKNWVKYEAIQSDIFDHLLAVAREFDLSIFQKPSGLDMRALQNPVTG